MLFEVQMHLGNAVHFRGMKTEVDGTAEWKGKSRPGFRLGLRGCIGASKGALRFGIQDFKVKRLSLLQLRCLF